MEITKQDALDNLDRTNETIRQIQEKAKQKKPEVSLEELRLKKMIRELK